MITSLIESGHHDIAERLQRCQHDRQHRQPGRYPWRCRSPGCGACRRTLVRTWWQAFGRWLTGPEISLAIIPLHGDPIPALRRLRKALRDVRDRTARQDHRWVGVAMAGLVDRDRMLLLVQHLGVDRVEAWATLRRRWPDVVLSSPDDIAPSSAMTVQDAAALARCRRGLEPIRIIILPQVIAMTLQTDWDEPMPMAF